jgi:hypothetical protein
MLHPGAFALALISSSLPRLAHRAPCFHFLGITSCSTHQIPFGAWASARGSRYFCSRGQMTSAHGVTRLHVSVQGGGFLRSLKRCKDSNTHYRDQYSLTAYCDASPSLTVDAVLGYVR